jgi:hypothetical protein
MGRRRGRMRGGGFILQTSCIFDPSIGARDGAVLLVASDITEQRNLRNRLVLTQKRESPR